MCERDEAVTTEHSPEPGRVNIEETSTWGSRSVDDFVKIELIGKETSENVYMARDKVTHELVALKRIHMDDQKEGVPITAIREIKLLQRLDHANVIKLKGIVTAKEPRTDEAGRSLVLRSGPNPEGTSGRNLFQEVFYLVFEYMNHDLAGLINRPGIEFSIPQIKCYMKQLLTGLHYCHINLVLHRDIKGSNLLIDNHGVLKLGDFSLARSISFPENLRPLTSQVVTLWYRAPEVLLGSQQYTQAVDMWSVGCIFAELLYGRPVFQGKTETDQFIKILEICGSFDETNWPGVFRLPHSTQFEKQHKHYKRRFEEAFGNFDQQALDLVERMLTIDPAKRITAKDALDADYFWEEPLPCSSESLPMYESSHLLQTKKRSQQLCEESKKNRMRMLIHRHAASP